MATTGRVRGAQLLVGLSSALFAGTVRGQPPATAVQAEQERLALYFGEQAVVSVPSAREEPLAEAPAALIVITEQEIRDRGYRDLMDVFPDLPGVDISEYGRGAAPTQVIVRGLNATFNKIVVLRDGVVLDLPAVAPKIGRNLPLYNIKRIEILYGPASVIYGSDAAAVVIQLISKEPGDGFHVEGESSAGSFDPLQGFHRYVFDGHFATSYRWKSGLALTGGVRTYQSDGPQLLEIFPQDYAPLRANPPPFTNRFEFPIRGWNAEAALSYREFSAGAYLTDHTWSFPGNSVAPATSPLTFTSDSIFRYRFFQAFARHQAKRGPVDLLTIATYGNYQTDDSSGFILESGKQYSFEQVESLRLDHRTAWTIRNWIVVTGGLRFQTFSAVPPKFDLVAPYSGSGDLAAHGLSHLIFIREGVFLLAEVRPWKNLKLTAGVSYEHDGNSGENVVLPRAGVVLRLCGGAGHLKALYGEGFEAPAPYTQYLTGLFPPAAVLPNPSLASERIRSAELRYEHRFRRLFSVEVGSYYNRVSALQQLAFGGPTTVAGVMFPSSISFQNLGLLWSAGGEVSARVSPWSRLQVSGSYALIFGQETLSQPDGSLRTFDLAKVARHKVLAELTIRPYWHLVADVRLRWVGDVATRALNSQFMGQLMPGYYDINLNLRAENIVRGLDAHLLVENLTDNRYYHFGAETESGVFAPRAPQPPFRFLAGLTYRR